MTTPRIRRMLLVTVLSGGIATAAHGGGARRFGPVARVHSPVLAARPGGGVVAAGNGAPGVILATDARGEVTAARSVVPDPIFITTNAAGEIFVGVLDRESRASGVLRLSADLSLVWSRSLKDSAGMTAGVRRGTASRTGGVVVAAQYRAQSLVTSLTATGEVEWSTAIDGDDLRTIRPTRDGGYVAAGGDRLRGWLVKLDSRGKVEWQRIYGTGGWFNGIVPTSDGGYVCVGNFRGAPMVMKADGDGNPVWSKVSRATGHGHSIVEIADGFAVTLTTSSTKEVAPSLMSVVGMNRDGVVQWQRTLSPGKHEAGIIWEGPEDATLLRAADGLKFIAGLSAEFLPLFTLDTATGQTDCRWFSEGTLQFDDKRVSSEAFPVDVAAVSMTTETAEASLLPLALRAAEEPCAPGSPTVYANEGVPPSRTRKFRARGDDPALEPVYASLFMEKKFAELDQRAEKLRRERPSIDPMRPNQALTAFYNVFTSDDHAPKQRRLELLRDWVAAIPESFTARIALIRALQAAAVKHGEREAETFRQDAQRHLQSLGPEAHADPEYWKLRIAEACGDDDFRAVADRAVELHPDPEVIFSVARCFFGDPEELVAYADEIAKATQDRYGDAMYMWLAYQFYFFTEVQELKERGFLWSRMRTGFEDIIRIAPEWLPSYHRYAKMAREFNDHATARKLFERPELDWYDDAVGTWPRIHYENSREWALIPSTGRRSLSRPAVASESVRPAVAPSLVPSPQAVEKAEPDLLSWPHMVVDSAALFPSARPGSASAFLVQTSKGVAAIRVDATDGASATMVGAPPGGYITQPLTRFANASPWKDPVYVVACGRSGERCLQTVLKGKVVSAFAGEGRRTFQIGFVEEPPANINFAGAAVVDGERRVFSVVRGRAAMTMRGIAYILDAIDVGTLLEP